MRCPPGGQEKRTHCAWGVTAPASGLAHRWTRQRPRRHHRRHGAWRRGRGAPPHLSGREAESAWRLSVPGADAPGRRPDHRRGRRVVAHWQGQAWHRLDPGSEGGGQSGEWVVSCVSRSCFSREREDDPGVAWDRVGLQARGLAGAGGPGGTGMRPVPRELGAGDGRAALGTELRSVSRLTRSGKAQRVTGRMLPTKTWPPRSVCRV